METIKFRGKQLYDQVETTKMYASEKGTWRYGSYVYAHKYRGGEHGYLILNNYGESPIMCDKNTIGQYTGLKDKNGVDIYENDIVEVYGSKCIVRYCKIGYDGNTSSVMGFGYCSMDTYEYEEEWYELGYGLKITKIEVIGNIHEEAQ